MRKILLIYAFLAVLSAPAVAGTIAVTPGSGTTVGAGSDGTAQIPASIICGASASATLYATCANQAIVNASGQFLSLASQSGTWTVQPGNTANTTAWLVTGTGGVFPSSQSGTWTVQPGNTANTTPWLVTLGAGSAIAAKVGIDQTTNGTTNGVNIVGCATGVCGLPTVTSNALVKGITAAMTATTTTQVIAAVTSQRIYVTAVHCSNTSATATLVNIQDGSGGTTLDTLAAGATYGGDNRTGGSSPLFWTTAGNALFAANVTTGASVICQASGFSSAN